MSHGSRGGHQKRLSAPDSWPIERKTAVFTVEAGAGPHGGDGVPLLILLRDVLGYVDSRKEARYALNEGTVLVNGETLTDAERPIGMFDILAFTEREEFYRVFPGEGGRLALTPISAEAADSKLAKVIDKRQVPGGNTQLNLHDGRNIVVEEAAYSPGDSLVIDYNGEVIAHFELEDGALVTAVRGQHAGEIGELIERIETPGSSQNSARVSRTNGDGDAGDAGSENGEADSFETIAAYLVVIDENFTGGRTEEIVADGGRARGPERLPARGGFDGGETE
jgi:small subunit ribosomal protein S4e